MSTLVSLLFLLALGPSNVTFYSVVERCVKGGGGRKGGQGGKKTTDFLAEIDHTHAHTHILYISRTL